MDRFDVIKDLLQIQSSFNDVWSKSFKNRFTTYCGDIGLVMSEHAVLISSIIDKYLNHES